jgi:hypothetical protein
MLIALRVLAAILLFILAGLNVKGPRFAPEWYAFACPTIVGFHRVTAIQRRAELLKQERRVGEVEFSRHGDHGRTALGGRADRQG